MPVLELRDTEPAGWLNYELRGSGPEKVVLVAGFITSLDALRAIAVDFADDNRFQVLLSPTPAPHCLFTAPKSCCVVWCASGSVLLGV